MNVLPRKGQDEVLVIAKAGFTSLGPWTLRSKGLIEDSLNRARGNGGAVSRTVLRPESVSLLN